MQFADSNNKEVEREASRRNEGKVMPVGESISLASIGKWLVGLVLAPWLWHERKRVDKLTVKMSEKHFTKEETKEQIGLRLEPVHQKLDMIYDEVTKKRSYSRKTD